MLYSGEGIIQMPVLIVLIIFNHSEVKDIILVNKNFTKTAILDPQIAQTDRIKVFTNSTQLTKFQNFVQFTYCGGCLYIVSIKTTVKVHKYLT